MIIGQGVLIENLTVYAKFNMEPQGNGRDNFLIQSEEGWQIRYSAPIYKKSEMEVAKVKTAPTAKKLTANGTAQALVDRTQQLRE